MHINGSEWRLVYSMTAIRNFEVYIQDCLSLMMKQLMKHVIQGYILDISVWANAFAFDVVGELAYGKNFEQLSTETDTMNLRENMAGIFYIASNLGHTPSSTINLWSNYLPCLVSVMLTRTSWTVLRRKFDHSLMVPFPRIARTYLPTY